MFTRQTARLVIATILILVGLQSSARAQHSFNRGLAVVLIDMQEGFYQRGGVIGTPGLKQLVNNQTYLLKWAVGNNIPVLVFEFFQFGKTDPVLMRILSGRRHRVIQKYQDGGFYGRSQKEALETLKSWQVDTLIVAGINGPYCVQSTIEGAMTAGFDVMTTPWVVGNLNHNPPTFPNGAWFFKNHKFVVFPTLNSIIH